jgi:hypothetical protein
MNGIQIDGFLEGGVIRKKVKSYEISECKFTSLKLVKS